MYVYICIYRSDSCTWLLKETFVIVSSGEVSVAWRHQSHPFVWPIRCCIRCCIHCCIRYCIDWCCCWSRPCSSIPTVRSNSRVWRLLHWEADSREDSSSTTQTRRRQRSEQTLYLGLSAIGLTCLLLSPPCCLFQCPSSLPLSVPLLVSVDVSPFLSLDICVGLSLFHSGHSNSGLYTLLSVSVSLSLPYISLRFSLWDDEDRGTDDGTSTAVQLRENPRSSSCTSFSIDLFIDIISIYVYSLIYILYIYYIYCVGYICNRRRCIHIHMGIGGGGHQSMRFLMHAIAICDALDPHGLCCHLSVSTDISYVSGSLAGSARNPSNFPKPSAHPRSSTREESQQQPLQIRV